MNAIQFVEEVPLMNAIQFVEEIIVTRCVDGAMNKALPRPVSVVLYLQDDDLLDLNPEFELPLAARKMWT